VDCPWKNILNIFLTLPALDRQGTHGNALLDRQGTHGIRTIGPSGYPRDTQYWTVRVPTGTHYRTVRVPTEYALLDHQGTHGIRTIGPSGYPRDTHYPAHAKHQTFSFCWGLRFFIRLKFPSLSFSTTNTFHPDVCWCSRISVCTCFKLLMVQSLTNHVKCSVFGATQKSSYVMFFYFGSVQSVSQFSLSEVQKCSCTCILSCLWRLAGREIHIFLCVKMFVSGMWFRVVW
jgi:hypothetical protein